MTEGRSTREALLEAGIAEINQYGVANFSMRRIARTCGLSPGAPYKHFGDRREFINAIIEYVNRRWRKVQDRLLKTYRSSTANQIIEMSTGYVQFMVDNPHLWAILTLKDDEFNNTYHTLGGEMSSPTQQLIARYCQENHIDTETRQRKTYAIRALIFGAVIQFASGELPYGQETMGIVHDTIRRALLWPRLT